MEITGSIILKNIDWHLEKCEVGYFIDKSYKGKGIISKVLFIITDHCFHELKLHKIFLRIAEDNFSNIHVAKENCFVKEGILRQDFKVSEGKWIDVDYCGLINLYKNE